MITFSNWNCIKALRKIKKQRTHYKTVYCYTTEEMDMNVVVLNEFFKNNNDPLNLIHVKCYVM